MKYIPHIVAGLLGFVFIAAGLAFFFAAPPEMKMSAAAEAFNKATMTTGFMHYVKVFEILGGVLVVIPKLRNFGLLILGPIIINIIAFNVFLAGLKFPDAYILAAIGLAALYLLWVGRKRFAGLLN
jgi:putative oxidoreductase